MGRGTNRVVPMCREAGIPAPKFEEITGVAVVTFEVLVGSTMPVTAQVTAQVLAFCRESKSAKDIMARLGLKHWKTFQSNYLLPLIEAGLLERTIPDKPRSRLQRYRTTPAGAALLRKKAAK